MEENDWRMTTRDGINNGHVMMLPFIKMSKGVS